MTVSGEGAGPTVRMRPKRIIYGFAASLALLIGVWIAGSVLSAPYKQFVGDLPSDLSGKSVEFSSTSGATLRGWLLAGEKGKGAVLLLHGVRANRTSMLGRARFLSQAGYSVLLFDFQAHGESTGEHITFGYLESKDAQAGLDYLRARFPDEKTGVIGVSMGGAAALLASPQLDVDAMVIEMVYPTIRRAVANRIAMRLGGWSKSLTPLLTVQFKPRLGISADELCPIDRICGISAAKLVIAGAEDQHTTIGESKGLFEAASEPKELWVVDGAGHVDLHSMAKEEYERRVLQFFEKNLR